MRMPPSGSRGCAVGSSPKAPDRDFPNTRPLRTPPSGGLAPREAPAPPPGASRMSGHMPLLPDRDLGPPALLEATTRLLLDGGGCERLAWGDRDGMLGEQFDDVLEAARSGGEWAWSRLYNDLAGQLVGYLRMSGAHEPEDLVGEVFVQVARNLHRFRGNEDNFRSWVFGVAHHRLIDERRYRSRRPVHPSDTLPEPALPDVAHAVLEHLATEAVGRLLGGLTRDQRDVLLLRIVGGLTVDEIGEVLNKRPGAVKALQRRGLRALRARIGEKAVPL